MSRSISAPWSRIREAKLCASCGTAHGRPLHRGGPAAPVAVIDKRTGERTALRLCPGCRDADGAAWRLRFDEAEAA
jgi:hypothetical protein